MRINIITSFAAGMVLSTGIVGFVYLSNEKSTKAEVSTDETEQSSEATLKAQLTDKGYVVLTQDEYEQQLNSQTDIATKEEENTNQAEIEQEKVKENDKEDNTDSNKQESTEKEKEEEVTRVTVNVTSGMTSFDVGRILQENKLIDQDAFSFSKEIEKRKLDKGLQIGKYVVDNSMSYDKIISTIFE